MLSVDDYLPRPGLSIPIVTVIDRDGRVIESEQRHVVRYALQDGFGADIIFAAGTNGEWDRLDNDARREACRIAVEECRSAASRMPKKIEAWAGITGHTRSETLENLEYALEIGAHAAVVAPLSIADSRHPVEFVERDIGSLFNRIGRMMPVFLYDNADISAPGHAQHLHTRDVKEMSRLPYVRGVKVTASKSVIGNYTRAASHFKAAHEFAVYAGNAYLIFDLFAPPVGVADRMRHHWNRFLTQRARPYGVVSGPGGAMPREWQRAWQVCRSADRELMDVYRVAIDGFRDACTFTNRGKRFVPAIACLKAALAELNVIENETLGAGTPAMSVDQRREFADRFAKLREHCATSLERGWTSEYDARATAAQGRSASANG
jgi:dihydrodipicolinate synthase/N-acetylneuraminate lyase